MILNDGCCPRHEAISLAELRELKAAHPEALTLAHPECTEAILAEAEFIGSTADIIGFAEASAASEFIIVTVDGVLYELERRCAGQGKRFYVTKTPPTCADMDGITLDKLVACLESGSGAVDISVGEDAARAAQRTLDRMLEYAAR